jgi:hypothetical protein
MHRCCTHQITCQCESLHVFPIISHYASLVTCLVACHSHCSTARPSGVTFSCRGVSETLLARFAVWIPRNTTERVAEKKVLFESQCKHSSTFGRKLWTYRSSGQYPSSCLFFKTCNVSETGFCLRLQVEPTQMGPIERGQLFLLGPNK